MLDEFKSFAFKGNVIDLAVGVIIAGAFGKIIDSLVKHIILPLVNTLIPGEKGYLELKLVINGKDIPYGLFIGEVVNFVFVTAAIFFFLVKFLSFVMKNKKAEAVAPLKEQMLTKDQLLLIEIRDLLKNKGESK